MRETGNTDYYGNPRVQTVNDEPSMTVQSDAHLADIDNILASFGANGMAQLDETALQFRDVSHFTDLADALNQAREAEMEFMKLPSKVREIFKHDVAVWLDTAHDEDKRDELVKAGWIKGPEVAEEGSGGGAGGADPAEVAGTGETETSETRSE